MTATLIPVPLPQQAYSVAIASSLRDIGSLLTDPNIQTQTLGQKILVVSNPQIWKHYGPTVVDSLIQAGFTVNHCILPAGERYKTPKSVQKIYDCALAHRLERSSTIVALGGGVIGDMTGFAAATWLRGINVVQIPTSLLAMVDAAIGGKTGVNHPQGKNLIGAFHQPRLVLVDPTTLATLPAREFRAGMAEVIKYGVIWDKALFLDLERAPRLDQRRYLSPELLTKILQQSCQAKAQVVSQDEKEGGLRAILNYGHTIGHAIESLTHYRTFKHGEAVALGMIAAGQIAVELNLWSANEMARQQQLIIKSGLPTQLPADFPISKVADLLLTDKKVKEGRVRFILPTKIGAVTITDQVPEDAISAALTPMLSRS
ncbi:MAG: 3-dehydroquinate synthase [Thermosynechococcaceae cyanobacterium]